MIGKTKYLSAFQIECAAEQCLIVPLHCAQAVFLGEVLYLDDGHIDQAVRKTARSVHMGGRNSNKLSYTLRASFAW